MAAPSVPCSINPSARQKAWRRRYESRTCAVRLRPARALAESTGARAPRRRRQMPAGATRPASEVARRLCGSGVFQCELNDVGVRLHEDGGRRQHTAWKNILLDEVGARSVAIEQRVVDGDRLHARPAAALEVALDALEVAGPVFLAH